MGKTGPLMAHKHACTGEARVPNPHASLRSPTRENRDGRRSEAKNDPSTPEYTVHPQPLNGTDLGSSGTPPARSGLSPPMPGAGEGGDRSCAGSVVRLGVAWAYGQARAVFRGRLAGWESAHGCADVSGAGGAGRTINDCAHAEAVWGRGER